MNVCGSILDLDMLITHKGVRATKESHYFQSIMRATVDAMYSCFPKKAKLSYSFTFRIDEHYRAIP
jgi:hypothetical protein